MKLYKSIIKLVFLLLILLPVTSKAEDDLKDIFTISRAISFMQNGPKGILDMAIIYDPEVRESRDQASIIAKISAEPVGSDLVKLKGRKVSVRDIKRIRDYDIVFVTKHVADKYKKSLIELQKKGVVTVSNNEQCLDKGGCLLFVDTRSYVEISMNTEVAVRTGINFAPAFRMMIIRK